MAVTVVELRESERARCLDTFNTCDELQASFPLTLSNGVRVPTPRGVCSGCEEEIEHGMVHGRVSWPIPNVAVIEAAGYCAQCQRMTQLYFRVRASETTFRAEAPLRDGSGWAFVEPPADSWWTRLRGRLLRR